MLRVRDFPRSSKEFEMATEKQDAQTLTKAERDVLAEALELKLKSHERAERATSGGLAAAHAELASITANVLMKVRNHKLEL